MFRDAGVDSSHIINMDETSIVFTPNKNYTVGKKGAKAIVCK
jgi:hypothetical protein